MLASNDVGVAWRDLVMGMDCLLLVLGLEEPLPWLPSELSLDLPVSREGPPVARQ